MRTPEDEAWEEMERRQGGGFPAKRAMAADKMQEDQAKYGASWSKNGKRIDPMSVYKESAQEPVAWRETYSKVIKALAAIVTVHTPDKLFDLDAIPREPVMGLVQQIKEAMDGYKPPVPTAQPKEQEPVAVHQFRLMYSADWHDGHPDPKDGHGPYETRTLYTAPPQRKPLTDAWIVDAVKEAGETSAPNTDFECFAWLVRKVEAAHDIKEKNNGT